MVDSKGKGVLDANGELSEISSQLFLGTRYLVIFIRIAILCSV